MLNPDGDIVRQDLVDRLDRELTKMAIAQYDSREFKLLFSTPLTLERARVNAILTVHYGINRRDCWAYTQARCPYNVKGTGNTRRTNFRLIQEAELIIEPYSSRRPGFCVKERMSTTELPPLISPHFMVGYTLRPLFLARCLSRFPRP
jgi:hypothetical protein